MSKKDQSIWIIKEKDPVHPISEIMDSSLYGKPIKMNDYECESVISVIDSFHEEFSSYLLKYGISLFFRRQPLCESVLTKSTSVSDIEYYLSSYIEEIVDKSITNQELVIVDPYFFKLGRIPSNTDFCNRVENIIKSSLPYISKIVFVTNKSSNRSYDANLSADVETRLKSLKSALIVKVEDSNDYHDRFWIANRSKAVVMGTSFNGWGNKLALVDFLDKVDVQDIVNDLVGNALI